MKEILPQLVVPKKVSDFKVDALKTDIPSTLENVQLERYASFFKDKLNEIVDLDDNYTALEIMNDEGLLVTNYMTEFPKFKVCYSGLVELLTENPVELSKINLVHAVMPFDDANSLVRLFTKIPEITNADTRVILGTYDDYNEIDHEQNRRVLKGLMNGLDFWNYEREDINGTCVRMVYSTYQKNMKMRR